MTNYRKQLASLRSDLLKFIDDTNCNPILVRLAWHDSGTFDRTIKSFPQCGGANGSIRFARELKHGANAGLKKAINYLQPFKSKYPEISWSDIIQLASVTAIEHAGGPKIPIRFGRLDTENESQCPKEGNLPNAEAPFDPNDKDCDAATHLRRVFYRMGFNDKEIVCLSGAHTLGRAFAERSGTVSEGYGDKKATKFTKSDNIARNDGKSGVGMSGGRSWTTDWLAFDSQYFNFSEYDDETRKQLLQLSTDKIIFVDPSFRKYTQLYAKDRNQWFEDYVNAHKRLSELGSKFRPSQGFFL